MIHIFAAAKQPATRFVIHVRENGRRMWHSCSPRSIGMCHRCGRRRWAKNLQVQVYYHDILHWCRDVAECKQHEPVEWGERD